MSCRKNKSSFNAEKQQILDDIRDSAKIKLLYPTWWQDCNKNNLLFRSRKRLYFLVTSTDWLGLPELGGLVRSTFHLRKVMWLFSQPFWGSPVSNMWPQHHSPGKQMGKLRWAEQQKVSSCCWLCVWGPSRWDHFSMNIWNYPEEMKAILNEKSSVNCRVCSGL